MLPAGETHLLYVHADVDGQVKRYQSVPGLVNKVEWTKLQLAMYGFTPIVKPIRGQRCLWRRTPVLGNHFYVWWVPAGTGCAKHLKEQLSNNGAIFIRALRPHDKNDEQLELGDLEEYVPVPPGIIDPRYDHQKRIAPRRAEGVQAFSVVGLPGSGKTVALQFAAKDGAKLFGRPALYVTYTTKLANAARDFFTRQGIVDRVRVYTLSGVLDDLTGFPRLEGVTPRETMAKFVEYVKSNPASTGPWRDYLDLLWVEINAFLLGMALPFQWKRQGLEGFEDGVPPGEILAPNAYLQMRRDMVGPEAAEYAERFVEKLDPDTKRRFFPHQIWAREVLEMLERAQDEEVLQHLGAASTLVVDEIQDFTLVQIALLARIAGALARKRKHFSLVMAGDESQTVLPSGFDWAYTKDLFYQRLQLKTVERVEFVSQWRSPTRVARIITTSRKLYDLYCEPQHHPDYPSPEEVSEIPDQEGSYHVIRWIQDGKTPLSEIIATIAAIATKATAAQHAISAFLAFLDLSMDSKDSGLLAAVEQIEQESLRQSVLEDIYTWDRMVEIKGLEGAIVIVTGLDDVLEHLAQSSTPRTSSLESLRNRDIIDHVRVALSRATQTIIIAERPESDIPEIFDLEDIEPIGWPELQAFLKEQFQDMDILERINRLLRQTQEAIFDEDYERASTLNRDAKEMMASSNLEESDIEQQIEAYRQEISLGKAKKFLWEMEQHLDSGEFEIVRQELDVHRALLDEAQDMDDDIRQERADIERDLELWQLLKKSEEQTPVKAFETFVVKIQPLLEQTQNRHLKDYTGELENRLSPSLDDVAQYYGKQGSKQRDAGRWKQAASAYQLATEARRRLAQYPLANFYALLADRYSKLSPPCQAG